VRALAVAAVVFAALAAGCSFGDAPDVAAAESFERLPIYWLGESFEGLDLTHIGGLEEWSTAVVLIYGSCEPTGFLEPSCTTPLQIQIFPLCFHLDAVWLPPEARQRRIRGAPVGRQDGAPVLLTRRTQIKVYRGEGSDAGMPLRALRALRSLNAVAPTISATGPIPPPRPGVLEQDRPCTDR